MVKVGMTAVKKASRNKWQLAFSFLKIEDILEGG